MVKKRFLCESCKLKELGKKKAIIENSSTGYYSIEKCEFCKKKTGILFIHNENIKEGK